MMRDALAKHQIHSAGSVQDPVCILLKHLPKRDCLGHTVWALTKLTPVLPSHNHEGTALPTGQS